MLLLGSVCCEVVGQVSFKRGVPTVEAGQGVRVLRLLRVLAMSPWIALGIFVYALEFVLWYAALSRTQLSVAFAFAALAYCGVVLASAVFLRERVGWRQWRATGMIAIGVALVCLPPIS